MGNPQETPKGGSSETVRRASSFPARCGVMELHPEWVVGFVDGEGCFYVGVNKNKTMNLGYQVLPEFRVVQHQRDIQVLYALKRFFGCGTVRRNDEDRCELRIRKLECLKKVVEFFQNHPLKTKKNVDFKKFSKIIKMMDEGKHLSREGLIEIVQIALEMNTGKDDQLKQILIELTGKAG